MAADVMVILAYHKFLDDWKDERRQGRPGRQKRSCASLSKITGDSSGGLPKNGRVFSCTFCPGAAAFRQDGPDSGYFCRHHGRRFLRIRPAADSSRVLGQLGRQLGKWIYAIDALDDYQKDIEEENYNPLIFRENKLEGIEDLLYNYLAEVANAYDLLEIKKNKGIIDNIIFMGLRVRTDVILRERIELNEQSV